MCYDYDKLQRDVKMLTDNYDIIEVFGVGQSVMGKEIPCLKIGKGEKKLLLSGAYHGLEYLTSAFLVKFLANYTTSLMTDTQICGYDAKELFDKVTL
ncbi:MAG: peptidase M14, partial [Clostridia bacterium]|nr:peptidase M14 [Clostridia bacterium]